MKHRILLLTVPLLALTACASQSTGPGASLDDNLKNPLFAHRYYVEMADAMVNIQLANDPLLKDAGKKAALDSARMKATQKAQQPLDQKEQSMQGTIQSETERSAGSILLTDEALYFGTNFITTPGPSLHVYLSTAVDPRQTHFPDATAVDLGTVSNPYGANTFALPKTDTPVAYRSMALWDNALGTFYGFAQLQSAN